MSLLAQLAGDDLDICDEDAALCPASDRDMRDDAGLEGAGGKTVEDDS